MFLKADQHRGKRRDPYDSANPETFPPILAIKQSNSSPILSKNYFSQRKKAQSPERHFQNARRSLFADETLTVETSLVVLKHR
jgi:hypothetical protein